MGGGASKAEGVREMPRERERETAAAGRRPREPRGAAARAKPRERDGGGEEAERRRATTVKEQSKQLPRCQGVQTEVLFPSKSRFHLFFIFVFIYFICSHFFSFHPFLFCPSFR